MTAPSSLSPLWQTHLMIPPKPLLHHSPQPTALSELSAPQECSPIPGSPARSGDRPLSAGDLASFVDILPHLNITIPVAKSLAVSLQLLNLGPAPLRSPPRYRQLHGADSSRNHCRSLPGFDIAVKVSPKTVLFVEPPQTCAEFIDLSTAADSLSYSDYLINNRYVDYALEKIICQAPRGLVFEKPLEKGDARPEVVTWLIHNVIGDLVYSHLLPLWVFSTGALGDCISCWGLGGQMVPLLRMTINIFWFWCVQFKSLKQLYNSEHLQGALQEYQI